MNTTWKVIISRANMRLSQIYKYRNCVQQLKMTNIYIAYTSDIFNPLLFWTGFLILFLIQV